MEVWSHQPAGGTLDVASMIIGTLSRARNCECRGCDESRSHRHIARTGLSAVPGHERKRGRESTVLCVPVRTVATT
jgi:hypothetical protein